MPETPPSAATTLLTEDAIVLRRIEFGDSSLILRLLTETHGVVAVLAKGAHREKSPLLGMLDLPFWIRVEARIRATREVQLLTGVSLHRSFSQIRTELRRYYLALFAIEIVEEAGQPAGSREMFSILRDFFVALDDPRSDPPTLWVLFELAFLGATGLQPRWEECAACGEKLAKGAKFRFAPSEGGAVCPRCFKAGTKEIAVPPAAASVAARLAETPLDRIHRVHVAPEVLRQIQRALDGFLQYHWGRVPRTRNFMEI